MGKTAPACFRFIFSVKWVAGAKAGESVCPGSSAGCTINKTRLLATLDSDQQLHQWVLPERIVWTVWPNQVFSDQNPLLLKQIPSHILNASYEPIETKAILDLDSQSAVRKRNIWIMDLYDYLRHQCESAHSGEGKAA